MITHHPARYRDPETGLPFFNSYAYKEIQRLKRGDYRFSGLLGAWAGSGTFAAAGVPERFLKPDAPGPEKKKEEDKTSEGVDKAEEDNADKAQGTEGSKASESQKSEEVKA